MALTVEGDRVSQPTLDEERLLVERARRNRQAFAELYDRYADRVYAYAYKRTRSHENAQDITSDTFLLALENIERYEWRNVPFSAWLYRIASNQIALHYRKYRPCLPIDDLVIRDTETDLEREAERISDAQDVRRALSLLSKDQRRAVELRYTQDMRAGDIAAEMHRTEGSVRLLLHRASNSLRSQILPLSA